MAGPEGVPRERFRAAYAAQDAPWDIGRPQPEVVRLARQGAFRGSVLDAGCGTGENALFLAARGHEVWGVDVVAAAIEAARSKAVERGVRATFRVADALRLRELERTFDTVLDCGLFHVFSDLERMLYARSLQEVLEPGGGLVLLCFSDRQPGTDGPRRVSQDEIRATFRDVWRVATIREAAFERLAHHGGARAWLAVLQRV